MVLCSTNMGKFTTKYEYGESKVKYNLDLRISINLKSDYRRPWLTPSLLSINYCINIKDFSCLE